MTWQRLRVIIPLILVAILLLIYFSPETAALVYAVVAFLAPLWLPALLAYIAWPLWLTLARSQFVSGIPYATLELKPGTETPKTARAMELVFYSLYHRTDITKRQYLLGHVRAWWSFEIYIHAGKARFFVHIPESHVPGFTARMEGEYHDMGIETVHDYSREIPFHFPSMRIHMREYALAKPDPYPLQTYEAYEAKGIDQMARMIEKAAEISEEEHVLISYILRPHQRERQSYFEEPKNTLHEDAHRIIAGIIGPHGDLRAIPPAKQSAVRAIEKALNKPSFDCGIRVAYMAAAESYNETYAASLDVFFEDFNDSELNGFVAYDPVEHENFLKKEIFALSPYLKAHYLVDLYRRRAFFAPPYVAQSFVLNTEELATVFHMPYRGRGGVLAHRSYIELEPPANLPV
ncbi:MAG: hypothetical protein JO026_01890 [Patescibacteria group bacterium]|nr:hypothetical protein [Patescibacteria group bacterium]